MYADYISMAYNSVQNLRSQFVTSSREGRRTLLYVFGEHGILMLSDVLNSKKPQNIQIMCIFNYYRKILPDNSNIITEIEILKALIIKILKLFFRYLDELTTKENTSKTENE